MRDYSKVSGEFWTGKTGRSLRGDMQTQIIAVYLMTSRHSSMIGVFHCPILYMAHETGSPLEGAKESLRKLVEGGFCTYDEDSETVWVHEMARFQIDDELKAGDKRIVGVQKQYDLLPESPIKQGFYKKYSKVFQIKNCKESKPLASPFEAPTMPEAVAVTGAVTECDVAAAPTPPPTAAKPEKPNPTRRGERLADDWILPDEWRAYCQTERPDLNTDDVALIFGNHWRAKPGKDATKLDWYGTWQNWVKSQRTMPNVRLVANGVSNDPFEGAR